MVGGLDNRQYVKQLRSFGGGSADRIQRSARASSASDKRIRMHKKMTGAQFTASALKGYGVSHVFYVEEILRRTLVGMERLGIRRILTQSEKWAAYMADGYARAENRLACAWPSQWATVFRMPALAIRRWSPSPAESCPCSLTATSNSVSCIVNPSQSDFLSIQFFPITWSMTHTDARIEAIRNGSRGATLCESD